MLEEDEAMNKSYFDATTLTVAIPMTRRTASGTVRTEAAFGKMASASAKAPPVAKKGKGALKATRAEARQRKIQGLGQHFGRQRRRAIWICVGAF